MVFFPFLKCFPDGECCVIAGWDVFEKQSSVCKNTFSKLRNSGKFVWHMLYLVSEKGLTNQEDRRWSHSIREDRDKILGENTDSWYLVQMKYDTCTWDTVWYMYMRYCMIHVQGTWAMMHTCKLQEMWDIIVHVTTVLIFWVAWFSGGWGFFEKFHLNCALPQRITIFKKILGWNASRFYGIP